MSVLVKADVLKAVRAENSDLCWRPSPDWQQACIDTFGHDGPCGWEQSTSQSTTCAEQLRLAETLIHGGLELALDMAERLEAGGEGVTSHDPAEWIDAAHTFLTFGTAK